MRIHFLIIRDNQNNNNNNEDNNQLNMKEGKRSGRKTLDPVRSYCAGRGSPLNYLINACYNVTVF